MDFIGVSACREANVKSPPNYPILEPDSQMTGLKRRFFRQSYDWPMSANVKIRFTGLEANFEVSGRC